MCYYMLAANSETFQSCPETLTLLSECCRRHGAEDLAPGQMSSIFSRSFRRCRVSLRGLVAPQGWLTHLSPLHPHRASKLQIVKRLLRLHCSLLTWDQFLRYLRLLVQLHSTHSETDLRSAGSNTEETSV